MSHVRSAFSWCIATICFTGFLASAAGNPVGEVAFREEVPGGVFLCIAAEDLPTVADLGISARVTIIYDSFAWLEVDASQRDLLERAGVPFSSEPDAGKVQVTRFVFDPLRQGEPFGEPQHRHKESQPGFRLVQFQGPIAGPWLDDIASLGYDVLQYYPHQTYLIWSPFADSSNLDALDCVRWTGLFEPEYKINADVLDRSGVVENLDIVVYEDGQLETTIQGVKQLGFDVVQVFPSQPDGKLRDIVARGPAEAVDAVAQIETVLWIGYLSPEPMVEGEMSTQIIAGNYDAGGIPLTGYQSWLNQVGFDGSGVIWSITDTGVDYDHPDLNTRIVGGYTYPGAPAGDGPGDDPASGGHGTHVAGIVGGDATGGFTDPSGFFYGLGVAPGYSIFAQNPIEGTGWPPAGGWEEMTKQGVLGGAIGANNSWTSGEGTAHGYQATERTHDFAVRDGNFDTAGVAEPYILVFSAGNSGPGASSLTSPKEAKNLIVTAGTQNYIVSNNIDAMYNSSSRGPAVDGRYIPTIAAPGQEIASTRNDLGGSCSTPISGTNNLYAFCTGTSMASPHASGSVCLLTQWWRSFNLGADPSPAMAKALLINGATDISGAPPIPNFDEGWGRINLSNNLDTTLNAVYRDQLDVLDNTGEEFQLTVGVPDLARPLKVTLVWSDAPGAIGANPALVNDLDLEVSNDGFTYLGNVFTNGWSVTGGTADALNNTENVYVQNPGGDATIVVKATQIAGDGVPLFGDTTDQDFALICSNCALFPDFTLSVSPRNQGICAPADALFDVTVGTILGYSDPVTLSVTTAPPGATVSFSQTSVIPPGTSTLTISDTGAITPGTYTIVVQGNSTTGPKDQDVTLNVFDAVPAAPTLLAPANGAVDLDRRPTFEWSAAPQADTYDFELALDSGFTQVVHSETTDATTLDLPVELQSLTTYFWHVRTDNPCGTGAFSSTFSFTTIDQPDYMTQQFSSGVDLQGWTVHFMPNGVADFYDYCGETAAALPTDPTGGNVESLTDDGSATVSLTTPVSFYGVQYATVYINANGNVTFTGPDSDYTESLADHFDTPRISAVFDDLGPHQGGEVSWKETADRLAISYVDVPELSQGNINTFQIELLYTGDIHVTWLQVDVDDCIAGLSEGLGVPGDFLPNDLSAAPQCGAPPVCMGDVNGDGTVDLDDMTAAIPLWLQPSMPGDINQNGWIDMLDLIWIMVPTNQGPCP